VEKYSGYVTEKNMVTHTYLVNLNFSKWYK